MKPRDQPLDILMQIVDAGPLMQPLSCVSPMCTAQLGFLWDINVRAARTGGRLSDWGSYVDVLQHHVLHQHSG